MEFLCGYFKWLITEYLRWLSFQSWEICHVLQCGIEARIIHTHTHTPTSISACVCMVYIQILFLWLLGIGNEIIYIKHIWDLVKYSRRGSYYYRKQQCKMVRSIAFGIRSCGSRILGLESWVCHSLAVRPRVNWLTSLYLGFLCWKIGIIIVPTS